MSKRIPSSAILSLIFIVSATHCFADPFGGLFNKHKNNGDDKSNSNAPLPPFNGPKKRMAVMPLENKTSNGGVSTFNQTNTGITNSTNGIPSTNSTTVTIQPPSDFGSGLTEMLTTELSKTNRFILLERANLTDVQSEQKQDADPSFDQASAAKPGSLLGAQIIIRGAITEYSYSSSGSSTDAAINAANSVSNTIGTITGGAVGGDQTSDNTSVNMGFSNCKASITLDLRIINASTGEIIDSVNASGSTKNKSFNISADVANAQVGTTDFNNSPLGEAVRQAIDGAVYQICTDQLLNSIPWEAQIAELDSSGTTVSTVYLDSGSDAGVKVGDVLTILKPGRTITSPETRLVIGRTKDTFIGHVHVDSVTNDLATASVVDGTGFAIGQCARYATDVTAANTTP
jgi:curli biogenesis system outer membrane secretion channel CsgG